MAAQNNIADVAYRLLAYFLINSKGEAVAVLNKFGFDVPGNVSDAALRSMYLNALNSNGDFSSYVVQYLAAYLQRLPVATATMIASPTYHNDTGIDFGSLATALVNVGGSVLTANINASAAKSNAALAAQLQVDKLNAATTQVQSAAAAQVASSQAAAQSSTGLSTGAWVAITMGGIAFVGLIVVVIVVIKRRRG